MLSEFAEMFCDCQFLFLMSIINMPVNNMITSVSPWSLSVQIKICMNLNLNLNLNSGGTF